MKREREGERNTWYEEGTKNDKANEAGRKTRGGKLNLENNTKIPKISFCPEQS